MIASIYRHHEVRALGELPKVMCESIIGDQLYGLVLDRVFQAELQFKYPPSLNLLSAQ
jgi:hypothetical protein